MDDTDTFEEGTFEDGGDFTDAPPDGAAPGAFVVDLDGYEGPIDVLLTLAREHKLDLTRISILALADQYKLHSIAFPAISTGAYRFPMELATRIAVDEVSKFLGTNSSVEKVTFVCFNQEANRAYTAAVQELAGG